MTRVLITLNVLVSGFLIWMISMARHVLCGYKMCRSTNNAISTNKQ